VASGHFIVGQLQSPSYLVMTVAFLAYGCLFLFLLALNHGYTLSLWRAAAFQRRSAELSLLNVLRGIASARDNETGQHISRTNRYVRTLAANLKAKGLLEDGGDPNFIGSLVRAAPLHDLGKVTTPDSILLKKGRLSDQELTIMREHASAGAEILSAIAGAAKNKSATYEVMELAAKIASAHHEHWDGNGYPRRLKGKDIPQIARIMTVADVYDALTSARPYKAPWSHDEAETYIIGLSGSQFDPEVVAAFHEERETFRAIAERFAD
jgi:response regulator RpfG family c-di-GMP phosphodiesterase